MQLKSNQHFNGEILKAVSLKLGMRNPLIPTLFSITFPNEKKNLSKSRQQGKKRIKFRNKLIKLSLHLQMA